ncbi:hypothetical protein [uncultured Sulfitobacter sp.]|uniref:hypothetical protein n=1 Tax=uncultured Sulfitobacter sp. TaxID=191468 RepID=UPI0030F6C5FA
MAENETDAEWIEDACQIFDTHAQNLGWARHVYSEKLRALFKGAQKVLPLIEAAGREEVTDTQDWDEAEAMIRAAVGQFKSPPNGEKLKTYTTPVIAAAQRIARQQMEGLDRHEHRDLDTLEAAGLMDKGICEDAEMQDTLEVGETMWTFNADGDALIAALRGES